MAEVNCTPLSVVLETGTPNQAIHLATNMSAQAVVQDSGKTYTQC